MHDLPFGKPNLNFWPDIYTRVLERAFGFLTQEGPSSEEDSFVLDRVNISIYSVGLKMLELSCYLATVNI